MTTETREQRLTRQALIDYRRYRKYRNPFDASHMLREGWARYLADVVVDGADAESVEFASACYRIARRIQERVGELAAVGVKKWPDMTAREQYWQTGRLAVNR